MSTLADNVCANVCLCVCLCVCTWCININKYASKIRDNNKSNKVAPKHKTLSVFVLALYTPLHLLLLPLPPLALFLSHLVIWYACLSAWANVVSAAVAVAVARAAWVAAAAASFSSSSWRFIVFRARCETPTSVHLFYE